MKGTTFYRKWACQKMIESAESNIWEGHWACSVLALVQLLEENLVPKKLEACIRKNLDKIIDEHANEQLFRENKEYKGFSEGIIKLLVQNSNTCNSIGHDVIYTYYVLDLFSRSDVVATEELFNAMVKLLNGFASSGPGFVTINGDNIVIKPQDTPKTVARIQLNPDSLLNFFHGFSRPSPMEKGDMQLGHILTHGHSIVELKRAFSASPLDCLDVGLFDRMDILTYANEIEAIVTEQNSPYKKDILNPFEQAYWEQALVDSKHGHLYKYAFSYLKLHRIIERTPVDFRLFNRIL